LLASDKAGNGRFGRNRRQKELRRFTAAATRPGHRCHRGRARPRARLRPPRRASRTSAPPARRRAAGPLFRVTYCTIALSTRPPTRPEAYHCLAGRGLGWELSRVCSRPTVVKPVLWEPGRGLPRRRTGSCRRSRRVVTRPASGAEHTPQSHAPPDPASERVSDLNMNVHAVANPVPTRRATADAGSPERSPTAATAATAASQRRMWSTFVSRPINDAAAAALSLSNGSDHAVTHPPRPL